MRRDNPRQIFRAQRRSYKNPNKKSRWMTPGFLKLSFNLSAFADFIFDDQPPRIKYSATKPAINIIPPMTLSWRSGWGNNCATIRFQAFGAANSSSPSSINTNANAASRSAHSIFIYAGCRSILETRNPGRAPSRFCRPPWWRDRPPCSDKNHKTRRPGYTH